MMTGIVLTVYVVKLLRQFINELINCILPFFLKAMNKLESLATIHFFAAAVAL
jgi:hypothetical protein